ncbi:hypothetical protein [Roseburia sp.]|uniref:hypothetical protein n=1 Tax=Roseburia sp. TaxID=2049040 RepID=UPI0035226121
MGKSKVTDYMIRYIEENQMDAKSLAAHAGIDAGKLREDYEEPLDAEEFLTLCVCLGIQPEQVRSVINKV